jgi:hypothetical protein
MQEDERRKFATPASNHHPLLEASKAQQVHLSNAPGHNIARFIAEGLGLS